MATISKEILKPGAAVSAAHFYGIMKEYQKCPAPEEDILAVFRVGEPLMLLSREDSCQKPDDKTRTNGKEFGNVVPLTNDSGLMTRPEPMGKSLAM